MKNIVYLSVALILYACGSKTVDKKTELANLKKQQNELNSKIDQLEKEVGSGKDSGGVVTDVSVLEIKPSVFQNYIQVQGRIDAEDNVIANAQSAGLITAIYVKTGQKVSKGQVLAQIDDKTVQQSLASAQTQVDLSQTLFDRQKNLWDQKIGTEVQYLQAKASKENAEKQFALIKAQAGMFKIISPINGVVDQMDLKLGQAIQPGVSGIRVINDATLKAKATLAESYAGRINTGDNVTLIFPDIRDSLQSKISFAAKAIDPISRSFDIEAHLPGKASLRPNMITILKIVDYERKDALVVPLNAIQKSENGEFLYVAKNDIAKKINIKTGGTYNGYTEVLSGLQANDLVISSGVQDLNDGDKIKYTR